MLSKHNRYIKYDPLHAKLYEKTNNNQIQYLLSSCYCVVYMDSDRNTAFTIYSHHQALHFKTLDIQIISQCKQIKQGQLNAVQIMYRGKIFGIVTKPYLISQLRQMLKLEQQSSISYDMDDSKMIEQFDEKIMNHFTKSVIESEQYVTYQSKFTISNTLEIALQKNGDSIEIFKSDQSKIKLIHKFNFVFKGEVSQIRQVPHTEYLCIAYKYIPILWFYNIATAQITQFQIENEEGGIIDFILSKEIRKQQLLLITSKSLYLIKLTKFFQNQKQIIPIFLPNKQSSQRFVFIANHSLDYYMVVLQNIHQKNDYKIQLTKGLSTNNVFITIPIKKKIIDANFSGKTISFCFQDGSIQLITLSSLDTECKFKDPIRLKLKQSDRQKYHLSSNQKFTKILISYDRTYIIAAIKNILVIWRMKQILSGDLSYQTSLFRRKILDIQNWKTNGEVLWIALQDKNIIIQLIR